MEPTPRSGQTEVDGRVLAWHELGDGPPLLLVNGYASTGTDWDPTFLADLASTNRVICPDNRGLGGSAPGADELTIDGMAADLEAVLDALELEAPAVAAWSMGGFAVQRLAARAPDRVSSLALISTDPGGEAAIAAAADVWARLVDHSGSPREQASRLISLLFPEPQAKRIDLEFGDLVAAARSAMSPLALADQERAMASWHLGPSAAVADPAPPTVVIHGELDVLIPAANAPLLARQWPGAAVELLAGCGHAVMAQEPARVAAAIRRSA